MCPTGSLPERLGMPPVRRTQRGQLGGAVALDVERRRGRSRGRRAAPRESIQMMAGPMASAVAVDGHGPRPLRRAADADDPLGRHAAVGRAPAGPRPRRRPTSPAGDCSAAAVLAQIDPDRLEGVGDDPPGGGHHRHLGTAGPEVDRQDVRVVRRSRIGAAVGAQSRHGGGQRSVLRGAGIGAEAYSPTVAAPTRRQRRPRG